jgi:hypothetical protein
MVEVAALVAIVSGSPGTAKPYAGSPHEVTRSAGLPGRLLCLFVPPGRLPFRPSAHYAAAIRSADLQYFSRSFVYKGRWTRR